jgi:hypothetical protein
MVLFSHLSPFRKVTLLSTQDPLRPFCLELCKYVDIDVPLEVTGRYWGHDAPVVDGNEHDVWYVHFSTPLFDFMLQPRSGDADLLQTPIFDTMVDDPDYCLIMLGEALSSARAHGMVDETAWLDTDPLEHATSMMATFLWNAAPWREAFSNPSYPSKTLVFSMPQGDAFDVTQQFRNEWGAIYVKALEAWWKHSGLGWD